MFKRTDTSQGACQAIWTLRLSIKSRLTDPRRNNSWPVQFSDVDYFCLNLIEANAYLVIVIESDFVFIIGPVCQRVDYINRLTDRIPDEFLFLFWLGLVLVIDRIV